jgi:hypothetical protein
MNTDWAHGGSSIIAPLAVPLTGPDYGSHIIYADCQAAMIKATKAIVDTVGHYGRPDVLRLLVRRNDAWSSANARFAAPRIDRAILAASADHHEVDLSTVEELADAVLSRN